MWKIELETLLELIWVKMNKRIFSDKHGNLKAIIKFLCILKKVKETFVYVMKLEKHKSNASLRQIHSRISNEKIFSVKKDDLRLLVGLLELKVKVDKSSLTKNVENRIFTDMLKRFLNQLQKLFELRVKSFSRTLVIQLKKLRKVFGNFFWKEYYFFLSWHERIFLFYAMKTLAVGTIDSMNENIRHKRSLPKNENLFALKIDRTVKG